MKDRSLAVFVDSFDGYSDIWDSFFDIFNHFWKDCNYKIYLANNEKKYDKLSVNVINTGKETNWFSRTIIALENIKEDYILFMLEDYFISKPFYDEDINEILEHMQRDNLYFYKLSGTTDYALNKKFIAVKNTTNYPINLQLAIWERNEFIKILKLMREEGLKTPWDFEKYYVNKYKNDHVEKIIDGIQYDTRDLLGYKNGVLQGKWIRDTLSFYKKLGININTENRDTMSYLESIKYNIKLFFSYKLKGKYKKKVKELLKCLGFKFMS